MTLGDQSYLENLYWSHIWGVRGLLYLCFAFPLNVKSVACGKRKNGVIRGQRDGLSREEDLEQCREAGAGLGGCAEWAGARPDNRLCAAWRAVGN